MLANSMVYSRFRHWAQCMILPEWLIEALHTDTQALIWGKMVEFDADEVGTQHKFRRSMKVRTQYRPRNLLGLGVMHWPSHVTALQIRWMIRYLDPTKGAWKSVLDVWFSNRFSRSTR